MRTVQIVAPSLQGTTVCDALSAFCLQQMCRNTQQGRSILPASPEDAEQGRAQGQYSHTLSAD
jgi:hypothetical protein